MVSCGPHGGLGVGWGILTSLTRASHIYLTLVLLTSLYIYVGSHVFPVTLCNIFGISYKTIVAGTQQLDGTWKHLKKWRPISMLHKKGQQVYETGTLGLSVGPGVIMPPCPPQFHLPCLLHSGNDSPRNKMEDQCRFPVHDAYVKNHEILMFFFGP